MVAESRARAPAGQGAWTQARRLLHGPLRHLVTGQVLGQAADGLAQIAFAQVVLFEVGRGVTPWELAKLLAVSLVPFSLVGPFAGVLIDRWDRRRTMVVVSMVRAGLMVASIGVLVTDSQPLGYLAILVLLASSRFVLVAKGAALPRTVGPGDLVDANAVSSLAGMTATFVGAVAGSTFVAAVPVGGLLAGAALYLAAAVAFGRLPPVGGGEEKAPALAGLRRVAAELADGVRATVTTPAIRRPLAALWGHRTLLGAGTVVLVLIADERYGLEAPGYGMALVVIGVGAFVGTWLAPLLARRAPPRRLLPLSFLLGGMAAMLGGFYPNLVVLMLATGIAGLAFQLLKVFVDALVQEAAPDRIRGRVFSVHDVLYNVAFVLAALALVPVWESGRERMLLWWTAIGFLAVAGGMLFERVRLRRPAGAPRFGALRAAAVAAGLLPGLSFPEMDLWWCGFVGLVPLLLIVIGAPDRREAVVRAWLGGVGYFVFVHHWLTPTVGPFILPLALFLALGWTLWGGLAWSLLRDGQASWWAVVLVPAAWVAFEFLRSWEGLGGPWGLLGAGQWTQPWSLAPAALGGVWLVGFGLVAINVAIAGVAARRLSLRPLAVAVVLYAIASWLARTPEPAGSITVAGIQPGVIHEVEPRFDEHERLTATLAPGQVDLVVWAESSVGFDPEAYPAHLDRLRALAAEVEAPLLINVDARRGEDGIFKSSVLVQPEGIVDRYDKMRLVPFGEYVPLRPLFGWVSELTQAAEEDRRRGDELAVLDADGVAVGPLVCFESAFPDLSRELAGDGADLIVLQTATTTFQGSWAQAQHASLAAVRAVESGRPVVHAALSGVSAVFDASGERLAWMGNDQTGVYVVEVPLAGGTTPFVRFDEWVPASSFLLLLGAALRSGYRRAAADHPSMAQLT